MVELEVAHTHFCDCSTTCSGIRPLTAIVTSCPYIPGQPGACLHAVEAELLLHNIYFGFPVLRDGTTPAAAPAVNVPNYPIPAHAATAIWDTIQSELAQKIIYELPERPRHCTPMTYKEEAAGKIRPIRDYSAPHDGTSVNDQKPATHFRMMGMKDAYACMTPGCYMAKADIKAAFRTVAVRPEHQAVLAFAWPDPSTGKLRYYADRRLPFGWRGSPEAFCRLSTAIRAMLSARGHRTSIVYVDDFLVVGRTEPECARALACLLDLLKGLGFTISEPKTVLPCQDLEMLGLRLESNVDQAGGMRVTVPEPKLRKAEAAVRHLLTGRGLTRKHVESTLGYLNHICQAIYSGSAYRRGLIEYLKAGPAQRQAPVVATETGDGPAETDPGAAFDPPQPPDRTSRIIRLPSSLERDLRWWAGKARTYNGKTSLLAEPEITPGYFQTDASDWGVGGYLAASAPGESHAWFSVPWAAGFQFIRSTLPSSSQRYLRLEQYPHPATPNRWWIAYREQWALFYALLLWAPRLAGRQVSIDNDNTVTVGTLNKLYATNWVMQRLVQSEADLMFDYNMVVRARWIPSAANELADPLSRGDTAAFHSALTTWQRPLGPTWRPRTFVEPGLLTHAAAALRAGDAADKPADAQRRAQVGPPPLSPRPPAQRTSSVPS